MKSYKHYILALVMVLAPFAASAQTEDEEKAPLRIDSVSIQLKLQQLEQQKGKLAKRIAAEDRKRNQTIPGVAVENMELINIRQDSLCLALRSEMTDIDLAIAEQKEALQALKPTPANSGTAVAPAATAIPTQQSAPNKPNRVRQAVNTLNSRRSGNNKQ